MIITITAVLLLPCAIVICLMSRFYSNPENKYIATLGALGYIAMYGILCNSTPTIYALTVMGGWLFAILLSIGSAIKYEHIPTPLFIMLMINAILAAMYILGFST